MRSSLVLVVILAGCVSTSSRSTDPLFDHSWNDDLRNRDIQPRAQYLEWVDKFYDGTPFVIGWTRRQAELTASAGWEAGPTLERLGLLVAAEWAKDNAVRRIDNDLLLRIGAVLEGARDQGRLISVAESLIEDVQALLAGALDAGQITPSRYRLTNVPS